MKCYRHPDRDAVGTCEDCGRGLCQECISYYSMPICTECNLKRFHLEKQGIYKEFLLTAVFAILGIVLAFSGNPQGIIDVITVIWATAGVYPGWRMLTRITPNVFLVLPIIGWVLYFIIKLFIAIFIGWACLVIRLVRNVRRLREIKDTEEFAAQVR